MHVVGIRELRQSASQLLRQVEGGETIEITDRGRPVALLTPFPATEGLDRLRLTGEIDPARTSHHTLPDPLWLEPDEDAPSRLLARLRLDAR